MDYYGFGKAGYYYTRRVYAPVLASFKTLDDGSIELWITNDTLQPLDESVRIQYGHFSTGVAWEATTPAKVPANSSQAIWRSDGARLTQEPDSYLTVHSTHSSFPANRHFFAAIKDLQRQAVAPRVKVSTVNAHELRVHVEAPAYVYFFHLLTGDANTTFSDNYFDLAMGESADIVVKNSVAGLTPEAIIFGWR